MIHAKYHTSPIISMQVVLIYHSCMGARSLWSVHRVTEQRRSGNLASSLVIYLKDNIDINKGVHMGRQIFRTTQYDWDR